MDRDSIDRIRSATFPIARRGYEKREVDRFLTRLGDWLETGGGDQARTELVRRELERVGEKTAKILTDSHEVGEQLRAEADRYAATTRAEADARGERTRIETEQYASETREAAESETARLRQEADVYSAEARRAADDYAAQKRDEADEYAIEIAREADQAAAELTAKAERDAENKVAAAETRARSLIDEGPAPRRVTASTRAGS